MNYNFETKANKIYGDLIAKEAEKDTLGIMPTNFSLDSEVEEREIIDTIVNTYQLNITKKIIRDNRYTIAGELFDIIAPMLSRETLILASLIRLNIEYNTNFIEITEKDYVEFSGLQRNKFYDSINEAIEYKLLARTTRKSIYIVNHNMIFRGILAEFIVKYKLKYPNGAIVDSNGKIVLNR